MGMTDFSVRGLLVRAFVASGILAAGLVIAAAPFLAAFLWGLPGILTVLAVYVAAYLGHWWGRDGRFYRGAFDKALDRLPP